MREHHVPLLCCPLSSLGEPRGAVHRHKCLQRALVINCSLGHTLLCEKVVHTASLNIVFSQTLTITVFAPSLIKQDSMSRSVKYVSRGAEGVTPQIARPCTSVAWAVPWSLWRLEGTALTSCLSTTEGDGGTPTLSLAPGQILGALCKASQLLSNSCSSTGLVS